MNHPLVLGPSRPPPEGPNRRGGFIGSGVIDRLVVNVGVLLLHIKKTHLCERSAG